MEIIYTIGWLTIVIIGFIWLYREENKNPKTDYSCAGLLIIGTAITWPISIPILIIIWLYKKFKK